MFKLAEESLSVSQGVVLRTLPDKFKVDCMRSMIAASIGDYEYPNASITLPIREDIPFVPILNIFTASTASTNKIGSYVDYKTRIVSHLRSANSPYCGSDVIDQISVKYETFIKQMYDDIVNRRDSSLSRNLLMRADRYHSCSSSTLRVRDLQIAFRSSNSSKAYGIYRGSKTSIVAPYFYSSNETINFAMMVKRDRIGDFRYNWTEGVVDPDTVEIWMDREFYESGEKTTFSKWIKETVTMQLIMNGFKVRIKESINDEIFENLNIEVNSIQEYEELKETISEIMLN